MGVMVNDEISCENQNFTLFTKQQIPDVASLVYLSDEYNPAAIAQIRDISYRQDGELVSPHIIAAFPIPGFTLPNVETMKSLDSNDYFMGGASRITAAGVILCLV